MSKDGFTLIKSSLFLGALLAIRALAGKLCDAEFLIKKLGKHSPLASPEQQLTTPNADRKHLELSAPLGPHFTFQNRGFWIVHKYLSCFNKTLFNQLHKPLVQEAKTYTLPAIHIPLTLHIFMWTISWNHKTQRKAFNSVIREFQGFFFLGGGQLPP